MAEPPSTDDTTTATTTTKPWPEFFDITSFSLPVSLSDATTRLNYNLTHFQINYINISLIVFFLTLALRPLSLLVIFAVTLSWYFLFFNSSRSSPLDVLGFEVDDRMLIAALSLISILALFLAHAWMNLFVSVLISGAIVLLHAVLRVPNFGDQDPYGGLLDTESGGYNEF